MKYANYFGSKAKGFIVVISDTPKPIGNEFKVTSKKEARAIAASYGATPWNF